MLDQALSSLSNFGLAIVVAAVTFPLELGVFELVFSLYLFSVGCSRALGSEPLMVRHSDSPGDVFEPAAARAVGTALVVALFGSLACFAVGSLFGEPIVGPVHALAIVLPGLLVQDAWRYVFFAAGRPAKAVVNDAIWTLIQLGVIVWLLVGPDPGARTLVLAWGASATVAAVFGVLQSSVFPRPLGTGSWLRENWDLAPRYFGEFSVGLGAAQLATWLIGAVGGLAVLGALRGALILIGPARIFVTAAPGAGIPELVRLRRGSRWTLDQAVTAMSVALAAAVGLWGAAVLLVPDDLGEAILGQNWEPAQHIFPLVALAWAGLGLGTGAMIGLRVLADAPRSLKAQLIISPVAVVVPPLGAAFNDATGAAVGLLIAATWTAGVWWTVYRMAAKAAGEPVGALAARVRVVGRR